MNVIAYTDGSYREFGEYGAFYSGAACIATTESDEFTILTAVGNDLPNLSMHNVAGEIAAVYQACEYCINTLHMSEGDTLQIIYDYQGIEAWCKPKGAQGYWKAKNPETQKYAAYMNTRVKTRFNVLFTHVKGHSGNKGNELADYHAKAAMTAHVNRLMGLGDNG